VKQKRKEKAGKWEVPIPKVKPVADDEMFKVMRTGQKKNKAWKRVVTKCTFVGDSFTRKAPKFERFIRPTGLRMKKANVTHPGEFFFLDFGRFSRMIANHVSNLSLSPYAFKS
jgi:ribosome biogenesis protein NSA2